MKEKYFNDAIIGNKSMVASFSKTGELLRLYYPQIDFKQYIDYLNIGVKVNDSNIIYLHSDINNMYTQEYEENTNILNTYIYNSYFKLDIKQVDFIPIKENVLIKKYQVKNNHDIDLHVNFLVHSKLLTNQNNKVSGLFKDDVLMQYTHDTTVGILSDIPVLSFQINNSTQNIDSGIIGGKDYIGMSDDSSVSYDLGILKPGESKTIHIAIMIHPNGSENLMDRVQHLKKMDCKSQYDHTKKYWRKYVKDHTTMQIDGEKSDYLQRVATIYNRSILLFPLLYNYETGGISAGVEVDENFQFSGRYSYCWPRDGVQMTEAFDLLNMEKESDKFYKNFCKNTQSKNGMWEQRFYTDGHLAPCWGYQIDETASIVYGVYKHYCHTKDKKFLKDTFKMCEKATKYLEKYFESALQGDTQKTTCYDLWEMNEGVHAYSMASIYAAFQSMIHMYQWMTEETKDNRLKVEQNLKEIEKLEKYVLQMREYIIGHFYREDKKSFVRSQDDKIDISLIGLTHPFQVLGPKEKKMTNTIEKIHLTLRTYTGGYLRFEGDTYKGGNPWVISNLWMANYYLDLGEKKQAEEYFKFAVVASTEHGFLPEQVNNQTMKPAWVIGLGWSHALFITTLKRLYSENGGK